MGLLNLSPDQWTAIGLLGNGIAQKDFSRGAVNAMGYLDQVPERDMRRQLSMAQLQEHQMKLEEAQRQRDFLSNLPDPQFMAGAGTMANGQGPTVANAARIAPASPLAQTMFQGAKAGAVPLADYLKSTQPEALPVNKIDPEKFTPASLAKFAQTRSFADLVPRDKLEQTEGVIWNPFDTTNAGRALPNPNKPFSLDATGRTVANNAYQQYEKEKAAAGASRTSVNVNTEKSLLNEIAGGLGKGITEAKGGAQSALNTIATVNRLNDALDTGKVMAGPGTTFRQFGLQIGNNLGVTGKDAQEKMLNTRAAIQSLAQLELDGAQQMKGQGQITEAERSIIRRAASGDIDGMTTGELRLLGGVLDRSARTKIRSYNSQVKPLASNPNAAALAPFLNVEEPPERPGAGGVRRYNPATGRIE